MDNQGEDFRGGAPPGRNNNNVRGGSGLPNMFSPGLRAVRIICGVFLCAIIHRVDGGYPSKESLSQPSVQCTFVNFCIMTCTVYLVLACNAKYPPSHFYVLILFLQMDPQYSAALEFEELRIRHQLEVQQDIELRRRLMEEQQHQLLSELEYRNKIQQLQELQEMQAQQQQQQGLSQLLAQNPHFLELQQQQQQQQYHSGRDNSLLASLRDDFLLQRHQQMLQDQMQQQLQEQLSRDSHQHEQEELLAMLQAQASGNFRGVLPQDVASLRHQEEATIMRQQSSEQSPVHQPKPPPVESNPVQMEQFLNNSIRQRADSTPIHQDRAHVQHDNESSAKKRSLSESVNMNGRGAPQDPPVMAQKKMKPATESPQMKPSPSNDSSSKGKLIENMSDRDKAIDERVAEILESQKLGTSKRKEKSSAEKKGRKKKSKVEAPPAKKVAKKKKSVANSQEVTKESKQDIHVDHGTKLSEHEQSVIDFLGSRGAKNGKLKQSKVNGEERGEELKAMKERSDDEAVGIVLDFKRFNVSSSEVRRAKKWSKQNQPLTTTYPVVAPDDVPFISPGLKFNIPSLPIEPDLTEALAMGPLLAKQPAAAEEVTDATTEMSSVTGSSTSDEVKEVDNGGDRGYIRFQKRIFKPKKAGKGQDEWWPSNACIRKERRKRGERQDEEDSDEEVDADAEAKPTVNFVKAGVEAANEKLETLVEPGVLEKLPHCKLYDDYCKEKKSVGSAPKFCCQTTETFPIEVMVCCSVCSTWRHAQCGGHYKRYTADNVDPSNILFEPICDQCYLEKPFVEDNPIAVARIERQRIEHLRRCNATNAVMRQVAFGKHSGQYKWPLGSVSISHISGHTRSVQARHEKAEKQWSDMAARLGNGQELRPRERQRIRTRELERLLVNIEDAGKYVFVTRHDIRLLIVKQVACCLTLLMFTFLFDTFASPEGAMDRHNMMLFLQTDTSKRHPAGFELPRKNIFDPDEDQVYVSLHHGSTKPVKSLAGTSDGSTVGQSSIMTGINEPKAAGLVDVTKLVTNSLDNDADKKLSIDVNKDDAPNEEKRCVCSRESCTQRPRFDSIFCSDSCGVSNLETDLLRTLQFACKLHPSILRS